ncbi:hypothetical protein AZH53_01740 [Methanomicrobiaceae archaeon CYW5]|uniref:roadblock/LC7 domain-containing protein n=1 Tax=Methanovulcanius yangii TaxID=1789227 RepID=UPI0029C9EDD1|nr:roadblock/LC7 domain-containing protein [Methanovulcanius yangii]MBT8507153.1 hypothetical protein [Methanovulcanius yangii]
MIPMLPDGKRIAKLECPFAELSEYSSQILVGVKAYSERGTGYLIMENGIPAIGYFSSDEGDYRGNDAILIFREPQKFTFEIMTYSEPELRDAVTYAINHKWLVDHQTLPPEEKAELSDEQKLEKILKQPGVLAVAAFFEGFPVHSKGKGDFEKVAAIAEDFHRAGVKIAGDLGIGMMDQIILETSEAKFILAPFGDLFICILTTTNANLGLIRLAIQGVQ